MQEMATKFVARGVLVLATEDDCSGRSIAKTPGLARKAWKTSEPLCEKPFQDQDLVVFLPEGFFGC